VHAKHDAAKNDRSQEAEAYTQQINAISGRKSSGAAFYAFNFTVRVDCLLLCCWNRVGIEMARRWWR
jgi:hypothetical protein